MKTKLLDQLIAASIYWFGFSLVFPMLLVSFFLPLDFLSLWIWVLDERTKKLLLVFPRKIQYIVHILIYVIRFNQYCCYDLIERWCWWDEKVLCNKKAENRCLVDSVSDFTEDGKWKYSNHKMILYCNKAFYGNYLLFLFYLFVSLYLPLEFLFLRVWLYGIEKMILNELILLN